ncbi:TadE/TadG family type IV pilus assembly protein [Falsiroseomonas sp. HW251]|uniref:TadE/TadG family type IV pilus assembly protein n=1 Tax=Falsiroseomonas sp. HW251 TaxID=3390998 RepID=UPI003D314035
MSVSDAGRRGAPARATAAAGLRLRRDRRGATAVEFAFVGSAFVLLVFGTIELARYYFTAQSLRTLSAEAARTSLISIGQSLYSANNNTAPCGNLANSNVYFDNATQNALLGRVPILSASRLIGLDTANNNASVAWQNAARFTCTAPKSVTVSLQYRFNFIVPFLPGGNLTLSDRATMAFD